MRTVFRYLRSYLTESILGPLFKLLEASFELFVPLVVAGIIDNGIAYADKPYILRMCLVLAGLALIGLVCSVTAQYFAAKAATGSTAALSRDLFAKLMRLRFADYDRLGTSAMITRLTSDTERVRTGVNLALRLLLRSPFVVFGAMIMAFTVDFRGGLLFAVTIPALSAVVFAVMLRCMPLYKKIQSLVDSLLLSVREGVNGTRVIRAFNRQEDMTGEFEQKNDALTRLQRFTGRISALMNPVTLVIVNAAAILLLYTGAVRVNAGELKTGEVVALYNYMSQILVELVKLADLIISITRAVACANRIGQVLDMPEPPDGERTALEKAAYAVELENVSLRYEGAAADSLTDIDLRVRHGQTVGIIGATGSGKTTLVNLIAGFYPATGGTVRLEGTDIKQISRAVLTKKIAVAEQKALLFAGTIRENLLWGNADADDAQLMRALQTAAAEDIIRTKANGLDEVITQAGGNLSGGQKQRLSVARALLKQSDILILDDSTSALDYASDAALRRGIASLPYSPTVFIVSQRTGAVEKADTILVLEEGKCVGCGSHEQLLRSCPVYREIHDAQFSDVKEEKSHE